MNPQHSTKQLLRTSANQRTKHRKYMSQSQDTQDDLHTMPKIWKAKPKEENKLLKAIRKSGVFSPQRVQTFVKFNCRIIDNKNVNYQASFRKVLEPQKTKETAYYRGSMNISDLWCEGNMQEIMGNLPYPKDRLKILKQYQKKNQFKMKAVN